MILRLICEGELLKHIFPFLPYESCHVLEFIQFEIFIWYCYEHVLKQFDLPIFAVEKVFSEHPLITATQAMVQGQL